jgi:hypothetical protein
LEVLQRIHGTINAECSSKISKVSDEIKEYLVRLYKSIQGMVSLIDAIKSKNKMDFQQIRSRLESLQTTLKLDRFYEMQVPISQIEEQKRHLENCLLNQVSSIISKTDIMVLVYFTKKIRHERTGWLHIKKKLNTASKDLNLTSQEIRSSIDRLIKDGFFNEAISVSF